MTQRRSGGQCPHIDPDCPYPVWPHPDWPLGRDAEVDSALGTLSACLNALVSELQRAVEDLSVDDVSRAMSAVPIAVRGRALRMLNINVVPRHVGAELCRDILTRLKRADRHTVQHALPTLTRPIILDMTVQALVEHADGRKPDEATDTVERWGAALVRAAFWASTLATVDDARICAWACSQPWLTSSDVDGEQVQNLAQAAAQVIVVTPGYEPVEPGPDKLLETEKEEDSAVSVPYSDLMTTEAAEGRNMLEGSMADAASLPRGDVSQLGYFDVVCRELSESFETTLPAARRVTEAIAGQCPPDHDDLELLRGIRSLFDDAVDALRACGIAVGTQSLAAVRESVELVRASGSDADTRKLLAVVRTIAPLESAASLGEQLTAAHDEAIRLLAVEIWDAPNRAAAEALCGLVELADPAVAPARQLELMQKLTAELPHLALLAIQARQLTFSGPGLTELEDSEDLDDGDRGLSAQVSPEIYPAAVEVATIEEPAVVVLPEDPDELIPLYESRRLQVLTVLLVRERRFGMAAELTAVLGGPEVRQAVLRAAAVADFVISENGAAAPALRGLFESMDADHVATDTPSLLLVVAALLRTALVTGEPVSGALLNELAGHVEPNLGEVAESVGRRALQGVLTGSMALSVVADVSGVERQLRNLANDAKAVTRRRSLRYSRATEICKVWLAPDGLLGRPLGLVSDNDQGALDEAREAIKRLRDDSFIIRELNAIDAKLRGSSGKRLEGPARQDVLGLVAEASNALAGWADAVTLLNRSGRRDQWSTDEVSSMREAVLRRRDIVLEALSAQQESTDAMIAAAAVAAHASIERTFALLAGDGLLNGREPLPGLIESAELLKVPGANIDALTGRVSVPGATTPNDLADAAECDWSSAVDRQAGAGNFTAAYGLLSAVEQGLLGVVVPGASELAVILGRVKADEAKGREELGEEADEIAKQLRQARLNNQTSDEQDGELNSLLNDALHRDRDLGVARDLLLQIEELLAQYKADSALRLSERVAALPKASPNTVERIKICIQSGQLSIAEELIYFAEIGEPGPDLGANRRDDLTRYFPVVPDALPDGLTVELINFVRHRDVAPHCEALDFTQLSKDNAESTVEALKNWRHLRTMPVEERSRINERDLLLPALRLAGIEARRTNRLDELSKGPARERRFIEVLEVVVNGRSPVPEFGSKLGGRLRVMLAWGQPSADKLMSFADHDKSTDSLLIAYFGTMSARSRRELAARAVLSEAPIIVLDDAALAYLAARGSGQIDVAMALLLPFSGVNPYVREKRGLVAPEMFYGREAERKALADTNGTQLVFGGRGLGKSALLRHTAAEFENQMPGHRAAIYLSLDTVGVSVGASLGSDMIWSALRQSLASRESFQQSRPSRLTDPYEQVREALLEWIEGDSRRRVLILLDECDRFFESDATEFLQTRRLKDLGQRTDGRVKVVFAGLHSVQRFAKVAPNGPFSHLAQRPTVIGPLSPQFASDLLTAPLHALGFEFEDVDVVNRVLGYCSFQPFLLQMFANRLIDGMHRKRTGLGYSAGQPPFAIARADIEAVEEQADLRADISAAFHETLHLDPRYNVIANVLAYHAFESGLDARMTEVELRDECLGWWPEGFSKLDVEGFRAYLYEMVGLGVLGANNDRRGWHLRSPNVLTMIGTRDEIAAQLLGASASGVPEELIALEMRLPRPDGRRLPLTASQLSEVVGNRSNQVRLILGSEATGIADVADAIREVNTIGDVFEVVRAKSKRHFTEELVKGKPGQRRIVLDDLVALAPQPEACLEALDNAVSLRPKEPGVTRSAVLIAGPGQLCLWRALFGSAAGGGNRSQVGTVTLRRYSHSTLDLWAQQSNCFSQEARRDELLRVTGGWPILVEKAARMAHEGIDETVVLRRLEAELATPEGAREFVEMVGLALDEELSRAYGAVLSFADSGPMSIVDIHTAVEMEVSDPATVVECLLALQLFDVNEKGMHALEAVLARCWPYHEQV